MQQTHLTLWQRYSLWLQQALIRAELGPWQQQHRQDNPFTPEQP